MQALQRTACELSGMWEGDTTGVCSGQGLGKAKKTRVLLAE